tara:strand:+ start:274 stop:486 length:213 start_codon:yes stop_codon:yes gene_type:complete
VAKKDNKNTRKMARMMKRMDLGENKKRRMADSSDDDSSDGEEAPELVAMDVDTTNMSKGIVKKKKTWSRA